MPPIPSDPAKPIRVRDMKVGIRWGSFFVAYFLTFIYAKNKEATYARLTGPVGEAKDGIISPDHRSRRFPPRFHYHHLRQVWQAGLSLCPAQRSWPWTQFPPYPKGSR